MILALTSKRFIQLNPVFEDKIAVVLPMPEPGLPMELSHACLQTADGAGVCKGSGHGVQVGPRGGGLTLTR